ncbi:arylamine N-acetyltransferase [Streptomyces sp. SID10362]|uniref:arylamine N-acetyltransferase family protein n=1 Tax=Streptomyces sp. SID10362 TaxID=2706021 RepID=UPI0013CA2BF0|nr:arylamine N-acetyltransferase [Streptomyces sp. SID10362]NDZ75535.1 arylamine N-acetyltransferase [Streptomyces sp. SID10362]
MQDGIMDAYLDRIGATRPDRPDLAGLRHLMERHLLSVPFENLDYHLGEDIFMDERVLEKIVTKNRGGGCYEVNPALSFLLTSLGYEVDILPGWVHRPGGLLGPFQGHLALRVKADGRDWLVDVGFGRNSRFPLDLSSRETQEDPHGEYRLQDAGDGAVDVYLNGNPLYRVSDRPVRIEDFAPTLWWYRTSPDSSFLQALFCSIRTPDGLVTLKGNTQMSRVAGSERSKHTLAGEEESFEAYRTHFGISLDKLPEEPAGGVTAGVRTE